MAEVSAVIAATILSLLFQTGSFFTSGFDLVMGDHLDHRLYIAILEHYRNVLLGKASFLSPGFFFPVSGVLAYTDCIALFAIPYCMLRFLSIDPYLAFQLVLMGTICLGVWSTWWLLRRYFRAGPAGSLIGAALFGSSSMYVANQHSQLRAAAFVPLLAVFLFRAIESRDRGERRAVRISLSAVALLYGGLLFTSFYIAWFVAVVGGVFCAAFVALNILAGHKDILRRLTGWLNTDLLLPAIAMAVIIAAFARVYLATYTRTGGRTLQGSVRFFGPWPVLFDSGPDNLTWGWICDSLSRYWETHYTELHRGWAPLTFGLFFLAGAFVLTRVSKKGRSRTILLAASFVTVLCLVPFIISIFGHFPWRIIYAIVPGAKGIRAGFRMTLVLNLLVVTGCSLAVCYLETILRRRRWSFGSRALVLSALAVILIGEQANSEATGQLSRKQQLGYLQSTPPPPSNCRSFYAIAHHPKHSDLARAGDLAAVDAELVSVAVKVPTLNGYSGLTPPDWNLKIFAPGYDNNVQLWVRQHQLTNVCSYDLDNQVWNQAAAF